MKIVKIILDEWMVCFWWPATLDSDCLVCCGCSNPEQVVKQPSCGCSNPEGMDGVVFGRYARGPENFWEVFVKPKFCGHFSIFCEKEFLRWWMVDLSWKNIFWKWLIRTEERVEANWKLLFKLVGFTSLQSEYEIIWSMSSDVWEAGMKDWIESWCRWGKFWAP